MQITMNNGSVSTNDKLCTAPFSQRCKLRNRSTTCRTETSWQQTLSSPASNANAAAKAKREGKQASNTARCIAALSSQRESPGEECLPSFSSPPEFMIPHLGQQRHPAYF
jgi:hypothetical protein